MKKLVSLLLVCLMLAAAMPVAAAEDSVQPVQMTAEQRYERMEGIAELIKLYNLESSKDDDPVKRAFLELLEDEEFYNFFMKTMLSSYDRYSTFVPADNYQTLFPTTNAYVGIGVTLQMDGEYAVIIDVSEGGAAKKAGVKPGDVIIRVEGKSVKGWELSELSGVLRGAEGTAVTLTVQRGSEEKTFRLVRKMVGEPNFSAHVVEDGIFYMKWTRFSGANPYLEFVFALQDMTANNCRVLILDLRGNPGGELNMAYNIINHLIPDARNFFGTCVKKNGQRYYEPVKSDGTGIDLNKIIILSDGGTASASEVIQSSLCDLGYAVSVGEQTYGKARGQYHIIFDDQSAAVITSVELVAPSGKSYEGIGLTPTYEVHNTTAPHPAASCQSLVLQPLAWGSTGTNAARLNAALTALGYLDADKTGDDRVTIHTLLALEAFQREHDLTVAPIMDERCVEVLNQALRTYANKTVEVDAQYEKALELARYYAAQPQKYVVDELGNVTNLSKLK